MSKKILGVLITMLIMVSTVVSIAVSAKQNADYGELFSTEYEEYSTDDEYDDYEDDDEVEVTTSSNISEETTTSEYVENVIDYLDWEVNGWSITITGCDKSISGKIIIPDTIGWYTVREIGEKAFAGCFWLEGVEIPDTVHTIGKYAFSDSGLTSVIISEGVKTISDYAFSNCLRLENIVIPESVTSIGNYAFYKAGVESVVIPGSIKTISEYAFEFCFNLESVTILDGVETIGSYAFELCYNLKNITIGNSVRTISARAFDYCRSLEEIVFPESVESIPMGAFYRCDNLKKIVVKNPDCFIYKSDSTIPENAVIYGYYNSTAHAYAVNYNRSFVLLDSDPSDGTDEPNRLTRPQWIITSGDAIVGETVEITMAVSDMVGVDDTYFEVAYDSEIFEFCSVRRAKSAQYDILTYDAETPGIVKIGFMYVDAAECNTDLIVLTFNVLKAANSELSISTIQWEGAFTPEDTSVSIMTKEASPEGTDKPDDSDMPQWIVTSGDAIVGETVEITVAVSDIIGLLSGEFEISYDPEIFDFCTAKKPEEAQYDMMTGEIIEEGTLAVSFMYMNEAEFNTDLITFTFNVLKAGISEFTISAMSWDGAYVPDDTIVSIITKEASPEGTDKPDDSDMPQWIVTSGDAIVGETVEITVAVSDIIGLYSGDFEILYDPEILEFCNAKSPAGAQYDMMVSCIIEDGTLAVSFMYMNEAEFNTDLVTLTFNVLKAGDSELTFSAIMWDGAEVPEDSTLIISAVDKDASETENSGEYNGLLYEIIDDEAIIVGYRDYIDGNVVIPEAINGYPVTEIGAGAFAECSVLTNIIIPDSVKLIAYDAFYNCINLESVTFGNNVKTIDEGAFIDCSSLKNVVLPESVSYIGYHAFLNSGLEKIVFNNPKCVIEYNAYTIPFNAIIYGYVNSPAQMYAQMYGRDFVALAEGECEHNYSEWVIDADAGCTQHGFAHRVCTLCNGYEFDVIDAVGHADEDADNCCDVCDVIISEQLPDAGDNAPDDEVNNGTTTSLFGPIVEFFNKILAWIKSIFGME